MSDSLFTYGSLRREEAPRAVLRGFRKRDDAHFPTIEVSEGGEVLGRVIEVDDWTLMDRYEGRDANPEESLYWRLEMADGTQVYVGNPERGGRVWNDSWDVGYNRDEMTRALAEATPEVMD